MTGFVRRRPALSAALLYAVLALALVGQGLQPGWTLSSSDYLWTVAPWAAQAPPGVGGAGANGELADAVAVFQPFLQHTRARLPDVPLWNPHVMGGRPFLANQQSAVFSPFSLPSYVLPFWWSLGIVAALKVFCAAFGTFLLARALGQRPAGALVAGLAFGFGLFMVTWLAWPLSSVWAWLPWLLLAVDRAVRRPDAVGVALLAGVTCAQFLGGHPESSFHVLVAAALFALLRAWPRRARRGAGAVALGLAAGGGLAALTLVPFVELLWLSGDVADRASREAGHAPAQHLLAFALPEYWGRPTQVASEPFINARAWYAGALPLLLAALALTRPSRERLAIAAGAAVAMAVVVGVPGIFDAVVALPGFAQAHNSRLAVVAMLAVALLAGWGLDDALDRPRARRWLAPALALAVAAPAVAAVAAAATQGRLRAPLLDDAAGVALRLRELTWPDAPAVAPLAAALAWVLLAGAGALALWLRARGRLAAAPFAALALALVVVDLFRVGLGQNPALPVERATQPVTGAIAFLRRQGTARFAGVTPEAGIVPLPADVAMRYGIQDARGYDYPVERRYDALWRAAIAPDVDWHPPTTLARVDGQSLRALGLLGTTHLLQRPQDRPLDLPRAYADRGIRIYRNPRALPRAWVVGRARRVGGERAALAAVLAPGFDPRAEAVVEAPVGALSGTGAARIARYEPERVVLDVRATGPALAILSDVWFPGWTARVNGRPATVERVDHLLRGVRVEGDARVELRYEPLSWRAGWIVSALTALALTAAVARARRRARRGGRVAPREPVAA